MITEDDVRRVALALPATTEKPSYGTPGFRVKDKLFARIREEGGVLVVWTGPGEKEGLIEAEPERFFRPAYVGHLGWIGVHLDIDPDWDEVAEMVRDAYRHVAPKRLVAELDGNSG